MDDFWFGDELAHPSGPDVSNVGFSEAGAFGALEIAVAFGCAVALALVLTFKFEVPGCGVAGFT